MPTKKIILITGATDGIGFQTALELAQKDYHVLVHGRNKLKSDKTVSKIKNITLNDNVDSIYADLTKFNEIAAMAEDIKKKYSHLDVLINNAGVFENTKVILPNGYERTFMINHLASFSLTLHLLELIKNTPQSRIVNVSSRAQSRSIDFDNLNGEKYYDSYNAYAVSKLENVLFTYHLANILKNEDTTVNCLHPGVVSTKLLHAGWGMGGVSLHDGAQNSIFAAISPDIANKTGVYIVEKKILKSVALSYDKTVQKRLWEISKLIFKKNNPS